MLTFSGHLKNMSYRAGIALVIGAKEKDNISTLKGLDLKRGAEDMMHNHS